MQIFRVQTSVRSNVKRESNFEFLTVRHPNHEIEAGND